ncbi:MAG TPA: hypothetical protein VIY29_18620 [Ktedonobacteraceae bacterium]
MLTPRLLRNFREAVLDELRRALEAELARSEEPPHSLLEVAHRLAYRSVGPLRRRLPELARAIAARERKHNPGQRESMSSDELRQALEGIFASSEDPPPSIHEVAQRLGYRSTGPLRSRFPELCRAIARKHQSHNPTGRRRMSSLELRQALEGVLASGEEPSPSLHEVASTALGIPWGLRTSATISRTRQCHSYEISKI